MSSLNDLRAYGKWLHQQGCTDWDDWETLVDIVIGKSELWDLQYLSEGDWDALDEGWGALGYWSYWDSAIHYLDVWIDFNEPWDDFDEEVAKRSRASFRLPHKNNFFKAKPPPATEGDNAGADDTGEKHSYETFISPDKNPEVEDCSKTHTLPKDRPDRCRKDLIPPSRKPEDRNSDNNNSSETPKLPPEKELDFMTAEVKAQIGRMDERITQILGWTQKQAKGVDPAPDPLELEKLEQKNANLRTELAKANDDKTRLTNRINELERRDSNRDEILLLLEEKLNHLTQKQQQQQASLDETLAKLTQTLQDKVNLADQVTTLQREKRQLQNQLEQTQTELTQKNDSFTAQLNSLSEENNQSIVQLNDSQNQNALLQQERSHLQTRLEEAEQEIANLTQEKAQLLTLTEQASEERSHLLEERQELQTTLDQTREELQFLQSQSSERSHLLEEVNHQVSALTQNLSPVLQALNAQLSEFTEAESVPETQALLMELVNQLATTHERLQRIHPVALPLLERLRQNEICLQTDLFSTQTRLKQSQQEKAVLQSDVDNTSLQLRQVQQDLENAGRDCTHFQDQLSDVTERLQQTQQQFTQAQTEYSQLQLRHDTLKGQLQQTQQQLQRVQQELEQTYQERSFYLEASQDREARTTQLLDQLVEKDRDLQQARQQLDVISQQRTQRQIELTNLENRLQQTQQDLDRAREQLTKSEKIQQGLWDRLSQVDRGAKDWFRGLFNKD